MEMLSNVYNPYIGANGNWYINNEDTGVKAQGSAGPQGPAGHCGIQGLIGPKGETGDRGPQGIQGPIGATGIQGLKGDVGLTGEKGDKGDTPELAIDLQSMETGKALDATMGKKLNDKISDINRNLELQIVPLALNGNWTGTIKAYKYGNVVTIVINNVKNGTEIRQPLVILPQEIKPLTVCSNVISDDTDNTPAKISAFDNTFDIRISTLNWNSWYSVDHAYSGIITYMCGN